MTDLIHRGGAVKALPNGHIEGYLVVFGSPEEHDLSAEKDFFTANTDYGLEDGMKSAVYFAHALDPALKNRRLTNVSMKVDDVGVWVEGVMKARDAYEEALLKMAQEGKMGWSSGTASHLVTRKAIETDNGTVHEILSWPLGLDASLTPCPAEPRAAAAYTLKSLAAMIATETPATKGRTAFTYDDLRNLLEQAWHEDFPPVISGYGAVCDSWDQQVHIIAMDDTTCVGQRGWEGELIRRAYTVTDGNDVTWGDPQEVARTTAFLPVTDGDDDTSDTAPMKSQADVAALKAMLRGSMTLDDHAAVAQDAMAGFATRAAGLTDLATKAGRPLSAARRAKLQAAYGGMQTAHTAMASHLAAIGEMLAATDPDAKKAVDELEGLRTQFIRLQSRQVLIA